MYTPPSRKYSNHIQSEKIIVGYSILTGSIDKKFLTKNNVFPKFYSEEVRLLFACCKKLFREDSLSEENVYNYIFNKKLQDSFRGIDNVKKLIESVKGINDLEQKYKKANSFFTNSCIVDALKSYYNDSITKLELCELSISKHILDVGGFLTHIGDLLETNDSTSSSETLFAFFREKIAEGKDDNELTKKLLDPVLHTKGSHENDNKMITGILELDQDEYKFLLRRRYIILAGRPCTGKTSIALLIAMRNAMYMKIPTAVISLELPIEDLVIKCASAIAEINCGRIFDKDLTNQEGLRYNNAIKRIISSDLHLVHYKSPSIETVCESCRKLVKKHNVRMIFLDYIQLISDNSHKERFDQVSYISQKLRDIGKELNIAFVGIAHLSRKIEERKNRDPLMSDLKDSGQLEQDADTILILENKGEGRVKNTGNLNIHIVKNRYGKTGVVSAKFYKETGRVM